MQRKTDKMYTLPPSATLAMPQPLELGQRERRTPLMLTPLFYSSGIHTVKTTAKYEYNTKMHYEHIKFYMQVCEHIESTARPGKRSRVRRNVGRPSKGSTQAIIKCIRDLVRSAIPAPSSKHFTVQKNSLVFAIQQISTTVAYLEDCQTEKFALNSDLIIQLYHVHEHPFRARTCNSAILCPIREIQRSTRLSKLVLCSWLLCVARRVRTLQLNVQVLIGQKQPWHIKVIIGGQQRTLHQKFSDFILLHVKVIDILKVINFSMLFQVSRTLHFSDFILL